MVLLPKKMTSSNFASFLESTRTVKSISQQEKKIGLDVMQQLYYTRVHFTVLGLGSVVSGDPAGRLFCMDAKMLSISYILSRILSRFLSRLILQSTIKMDSSPVAVAVSHEILIG